MISDSFLLVSLQKTPSLLGGECQGVGTTPLHANERGKTVRFVAVIEPRVYTGISISRKYKLDIEMMFSYFDMEFEVRDCVLM